MNDYFTGHCRYSENLNLVLNRHDIVPILIMRNPYDVLFSQARYFPKWKDIFHSKYLISDDVKFNIKILSSDEAASRKIDHDMFRQYDAYIPWLQNYRKNIFRFEDLVGSKGGGSISRQKQEFIRLLDLLEIEFPTNQIQKTIDRIFGVSNTFDQGQVGFGKKFITN